MKKRNALILAAAALVVGMGINNIAMSDIAAQKIAVVDVPAVVAKSAQVQSLKTEQQKKTEEIEKWLQNVKADIDKQQTREGKEKLIKKYDAEFAKKREAVAKSYGQKLQTIDKSISTTIATEAKKQGYTLVLTKSSVLYGGDDITASIQKVVK